MLSEMGMCLVEKGNAELLAPLKENSRFSTQFLLLAHLYAQTDASALTCLRKHLIVPTYTPKEWIVRTTAYAAAGIGKTNR